LPAAIVSNRPDVRSAEIDVMIANAKVGIAQSYMYPSLTIDAGAGLESFKASNWFNIPGSLFGIVTGGIAQPIFDRKQLKTNYEVAKLQRDQSVIQFRQSVLNAVTDVSNALVSVDKLKQEEQIADSETTTLHQAISNSLLLYKSDMANYLDVITAQSSALQAELNLASIRSRELMAVVELYRSVGGGWK
jgi:multidrug efflux system outer membrane protein